MMIMMMLSNWNWRVNAAVAAERCARLFDEIVSRTIAARIDRTSVVGVYPFFDGDIIACHQLFHSLAILVYLNGGHGLNFKMIGQFA